MSETAQADYASKPIPVGLTADTGDLPAAYGWVVHELRQSRQGQPTIWAWCRVSDQHPGYSTVVYTLNDGVTAADPGPNPQLGPVVVKMFC